MIHHERWEDREHENNSVAALEAEFAKRLPYGGNRRAGMTQWELEAIAAYYTGDSEPRGYHLAKHHVNQLLVEIKRLQLELADARDCVATVESLVARIREVVSQ